ncbi:MAG: hypothetical protein Q4A83_04865 [Bacillota bacterium]|nr:hypothetical protein [Bacillota bacterium]
MNVMKPVTYAALRTGVNAAPINAMLRRAYMRGVRDAMSFESAEQPALSAMLPGFLCWAALLFFVFR